MWALFKTTEMKDLKLEERFETWETYLIPRYHKNDGARGSQEHRSHDPLISLSPENCSLACCLITVTPSMRNHED